MDKSSTSLSEKLIHRPCLGILDSGIGGLTVLQSLEELGWKGKVLYLADTAYHPYGSQTPELLRERFLENALRLCEEGAELIAIGCHTLSVMVDEELCQRIPCPVIPIVQPLLKAADKMLPTSSILILGTVRTVDSHIYQDALRGMAPKASLQALACPQWASLVEKGERDFVLRKAIQESLHAVALQDVSLGILACTHFSFLKPFLRELFPHVHWIEGSQTLAQVVMKEKPCSSGSLEVVYESTGEQELFLQKARLVFQS